VVTTCTTNLNIKELCILNIEPICVIHMILRINSDYLFGSRVKHVIQHVIQATLHYFLEQYSEVEIPNGDIVFFKK
jgi:hypothetical protein